MFIKLDCTTDTVTLTVMICYILVMVVLAVSVYFIRWSKQNVPLGMKIPPIEKGWPIIGILNDTQGPLCNYLTQLGKKHGPIYRIKLGMRDILVLNNFEHIKAALVDNVDAYAGRWKLYKYIFMTKGSGIFFTEGDIWADQRSYLLKTLREFGFGRSISVEMVQDECICLLKDLEKLNSKPVDVATFIPLYISNVMSRFIMNKRFTQDDPEFRTIDETLKVIFDNKDTFAQLPLMLPIFDKNEWLLKFMVWITSRNSVFRASHGIFEKEVKERLQTLDFNSEGNDLMDRYLIKQHKMNSKDGSIGFFTYHQLIISAFEFFIGGYDTTSSTLTWSIMFMALYPDVQKKVYEEIFDQIGTERLPTMSDKPSLVYTQAVMDEIFRLSSVAPLGLLHRTLRDTCVNGYFIPKDTIVMKNIFACHVDPATWEKPLEFNPAHFLSTDERGNLKYSPREELISFSIGKRQCPGEPLARTNYFIFFTSILQKFQVSLPAERTEKTLFNVFRAGDGLVRKSPEKDFVFKKRS